MKALLIFSIAMVYQFLSMAQIPLNLEVKGHAIIDSSISANALKLKDDLGNNRIVLNADSAAIELWANDTMWYQLKVASPPEELVRSGKYTKKTNYEGDKKIDSYYDEDNVLIYRTISNPFGDQFSTIEQMFVGNCLKSEHKKSNYFPDQREITIVYDCPSGDTCYVDYEYILFTIENGYQNPVPHHIKHRKYYKEVFEYYHGDLMGVDNSKAIPNYRIDDNFVKNGDTLSQEVRELNEEELKLFREIYNRSSQTEKLDTCEYLLEVTKGTDTLQFRIKPQSKTFEYSLQGGGSGICTLDVKGHLMKLSGTFRIDHPLDPFKKYLSHSFVESPDMMNIYNGNISTDELGYATVPLPDYFEALNKDFRYQLTVIGDFAQAIVKEKIRSNQFVIQTDKPHVEVSWQVTGIRNDTYARENRIQVEADKPVGEIGKLLYLPTNTYKVNH